MLLILYLITNPPDLFSGKAGHNRDSGNIGGTTSDSMLRRGNVDKRGLCYFSKFVKTNSVAKQNFGNGTEDDEERVENLFFDLILHAR